MNLRLLFLPGLLAAAFFAMTGAARADRNPDFDGDATPILRAQPQLVEYVHRHFEVKDTGQARIPGDDEHAPQPPFIFMARPRNSGGPYFIRLLVQPGPPGHILKVVDIRTVHLSPPSQPDGSFQTIGAAPAPAPGSVSAGPEPSAPPSEGQPPAQVQPPAAPAPASAPAPSEPTADTPSGPIPDPSAGSSTTPDHLAPPPDPAPAPRTPDLLARRATSP